MTKQRQAGVHLKSKGRKSMAENTIKSEVRKIISVTYLSMLLMKMSLAVDILLKKNKDKRTAVQESIGQVFLHECPGNPTNPSVRQIIIKALANGSLTGTGSLTERRCRKEIGNLVIEYVRLEKCWKTPKIEVFESSLPSPSIEKEQEKEEFVCKLSELEKQFVLAISLGKKKTENVGREV